MKTKKEINDALKARIKQLDDSIAVLNEKNGPYWSRAIMDTVREELNTFLEWMNNND